MNGIPTVLVIDDDKFFVEFYRSELSQYNIQTESALDGELGVSKAIELLPDAILLDAIIPKKDGFQVLAELKANEKTKHIPLIVISSLNSGPDQERLIAAGADKLFNKLIDLPRDVAEYVQKLLEEQMNNAEKSKPVEVKTEEPKSAETAKEETTANKIQETLEEAKKAGAAVLKESTDAFFKSCLEEVEKAFLFLFGQKSNGQHVDMNFIPFVDFKEKIKSVRAEDDTKCIYAKIEAQVPGVAIMIVRKKDVVTMAKRVNEVMFLGDPNLSESDKVAEEFFNIVINAFLTKFASSVKGLLILLPPITADCGKMLDVANDMTIFHNGKGMAVYLQETFSINDIEMPFSIYIAFSGE
jgi:CheY-like chemotaxis protein